MIAAVLLNAVSLPFLAAFMLVSTLIWIHLSFSGIPLERAPETPPAPNARA